MDHSSADLGIFVPQILLNSPLVLLFLLLFLLLRLPYLEATASVGLVGNFSLILAILCWPKLRKSREVLYVLVKALFDSFYLAAFFGEFHGVRLISYGICVGQDSLILFSRQMSAAVTIALLVERFLAMMCPEEYEKYSEQMNRWKIFAIFTLPLALWAILLGTTGFSPNNSQEILISLDESNTVPQCVRLQNVLRRIGSFASYILNFFSPLLLFALTNLLIAFKVHYSATLARFIAPMRKRLTSPSPCNVAKEFQWTQSSSAIPFLFSLVFVLLNSPIYILNFAYSPYRNEEYAASAVAFLKIVANLANLSTFALNLSIFVLAKMI